MLPLHLQWQTLPLLFLKSLFSSFFFNDTATTEIYTLSLHDALPIFLAIIQTFFLISWFSLLLLQLLRHLFKKLEDRKSGSAGMPRPTSYAVFCLKKKKGSKQHNEFLQ